MLTKRQLEDAAECMSHDCESCGVREFAGGCCQIATAQTALALAKMLRRLEWSNRIPLMRYLPVYEHRCPLCGWPEFNGHAPNCELGNMLKGLEGESC
jgi:hypothetical protein